MRMDLRRFGQAIVHVDLTTGEIAMRPAPAPTA